MLLILISWIYIFITTLNFGFLFRSLFKIEKCHIIIHHVLGLFLFAIITSISAFFVRIHFEYYIAILIINIATTLFYINPIKRWLYQLKEIFNGLQINFKVLFGFIFIICLAQSATLPYLLDNETYYIQTIKWLNEYGFVKGLANLHMLLGQNSTWHVLQAGFNFPFISHSLNDLNGFVFVIMSFLFIEKLNHYQSNPDIESFNLGLMLLFSLFLFQFINAPSPDLIIFLIAPYLFYLFTTTYKSITRNDFMVLLSLTIFLCFIKVTAIVLLLLPLILFIKHFSLFKAEIGLYFILSSITLIVFISKNTIISGYPLYPVQQFNIINLDWKVPTEVMEFYKLGTDFDGMTQSNNTDVGFFEKLKFWLFSPKLDGLFNKVYLLLLMIFPFFIYKLENKTQLLIIYLIAIIQFILLWFTSPQYRFFFIFIAFLGIQLFSFVFRSKKLSVYLVIFATVISAIPIFLPISLKAFTNNNFAMKLNTFELKSIILPEKNSKTITTYTEYNIDGFEFYSPDNDVFFWVTGNGSLPCVNKKQIEYFKTYYDYIPELRTKRINDGFKSKKIN